jgi:sulfatase maturation enzyme AslB (radical SAM superfamily)
MDSQITTLMSKLFDTVKILHIESTDVCQAACPLCARETDSTFNKSIQHNLTVRDIKQIIPESVIKQLDKMFMCGNYGDPAANNNSISIFSHFRQINNSIVLGMNTNGALQSKYWWADLANILHKPEDYVVFSIDGLEDTNHLYRKNVNWSKLMNNAEIFIKSGGNAHWDMLVYEHNEHQIDACEKLAKKMGFKWFRTKVSKRCSNISWLKPPKNYSIPVVTQGQIDCFRNKDLSLYLSARGQFYPCCWLGHSENTVDKFDEVQKSWNTDNCNPVCKMTCSNSITGTNFINQWKKNIQINIL